MRYRVKRFLHTINIFRYLKNFFFCLKYPFWKMTDSWYCVNTSINDRRIGSKNFFVNYSSTWYDDIPHGWRKAFGKDLSRELLVTGKKYIKEQKKLGKKVSWRNIISFDQIKEKYGELRLYASATQELMHILEKYELLSTFYCICCGKKARFISQGWIEFYCEKCFEKYECWKYDSNAHEKVPLDEESMKKYKDKCKITEKDIPKLTSYEYKVLSTEEFEDEETCNKRFEELWDSEDRPTNEVYSKKHLNDKWVVEYQEKIEHLIDLKQEYGIDVDKLMSDD